MRKSFGTYFSELRRRNAGLSLREWCAEHGFDAGNVSRMERDLAPPPASYEKLGEYARALRMEEYSDEWFEFLDAAARARREFPADLKADEELMDLMPVLFRAYRQEAASGEPISEDGLRRLLNMLRNT
jgi:transcriptional regulator with XRE-family HTH domain